MTAVLVEVVALAINNPETLVEDGDSVVAPGSRGESHVTRELAEKMRTRTRKRRAE